MCKTGKKIIMNLFGSTGRFEKIKIKIYIGNLDGLLPIFSCVGSRYNNCIMT